MYLGNDGKSAYATLPKQQKSTLLPRVSTHAYAGCIVSTQQPTRLYEFPRIHDVGHSKKTCSSRCGLPTCPYILNIYACRLGSSVTRYCDLLVVI